MPRNVVTLAMVWVLVFFGVQVALAGWEPPSKVSREAVVEASNTVLARPDIKFKMKEDIFRIRALEMDWDMGAIPVTASHLREYNEKVRAEKLARGHLHIHIYFNTIDAETQDGKTVRIAHKGRLTALDDPEVRQLASKYGNPDELLQEAWIPAIPGINVKGDYKDYAAYPGRWIKLDVEQLEKHVPSYPR